MAMTMAMIMPLLDEPQVYLLHLFSLTIPPIMLDLTPSEMMDQGLALIGHKEVRISRLTHTKKSACFRADFGKDADVFSNLWRDLQLTNITAAKITNANNEILAEFLWTLHWLKSYPTEEQLESRTHWCNKTIRKKIKGMIIRIAALRPSKIFWPESWSNPNESPAFLITVDGTHCPIQEPTKGHKYSKNPKYYSHKFNWAALAYEVAISIFTNQVVWINGPFPAGMGDDEIFILGLKAQMPVGKKAIADGVYKRHDLPMISTNYKADTAAVRLFKRRAKA